MNNFGSKLLRLKSNPKALLVVIIVLIVVVVALSISFKQVSEKEEISIEEEIIPDKMKTGNVGKIEEGKSLEEINPEAIKNPVRVVGTSLPPVIFNTKGTVNSVGKDRIIITGNGSNFEDQKKRTLSIFVNSKTIIFEKGKSIRYEGKEGLKYLSIGDMVSVEASQNIRGRTDFMASYINKI